jgi:hypothetical protein
VSLLVPDSAIFSITEPLRERLTLPFPFYDRGTNESTIGLWYTIQGTGGVFEASMNITGALEFSVYSGDSCDMLTCVASQDRPLLPMDWETTEGQAYFIYVFGTNAYEKGEFSIVVNEVTRPTNDLCSEATNIEVNGQAVAGTTRVSMAETLVEYCGEVFLPGYGGVW